MNEVPTAEDHPLLQIAIDWLEPGDTEKYSIHPQGGKALELGLDTLFLSDVDPKPALGQLAGLAEALRQTGSRTAANEIAQLMVSHPKAGSIIKALDGDVQAIEAEKFLRGASPRRTAQHIDDRAPEGSIRLSALAPPRTKIR